MRKFGIIASMGCAFALCLALAGCGGGASSGTAADDSAAAKAAFTGTWDLVSLVEDGEETSADDIEMLKSLGLDVYLNLNEDGSSELVLFGESMEGTWDASSTTEGSISMEGQSVGMKLDGDQLCMEQDGSSLTFQKGEARDADADDADADDADAESSDAADTDADAEDGEASDESASSESSAS